MVRWLWRRVRDSQDVFVFVGLQEYLAKLRCVFGIIILSLENGVMPLLIQVKVNSIQVSQSTGGKTAQDLNIPTTIRIIRSPRHEGKKKKNLIVATI